VGLRATQFTILQALTLAGEVTQSQLSEMLVIDSCDTQSNSPNHGQRGLDRRMSRQRPARTLAAFD
jgi:hypothetical protein